MIIWQDANAEPEPQPSQQFDWLGGSDPIELILLAVGATITLALLVAFILLIVRSRHAK